MNFLFSQGLLLEIEFTYYWNDAYYLIKKLCKQIEKVFPAISACDIDLTVDYDDEKKAWLVDLKKDNHELKTFLEENEADECMAGKQSISLGLQISQLRVNIDSMDQEMPRSL